MGADSALAHRPLFRKGNKFFEPPSQLDPISDVEGWHIDAATKHDIDAILKRCIVDPVSSAFMAPPVIRPKEQKRLAA